MRARTYTAFQTFQTEQLSKSSEVFYCSKHAAFNTTERTLGKPGYLTYCENTAPAFLDRAVYSRGVRDSIVWSILSNLLQLQRSLHSGYNGQPCVNTHACDWNGNASSLAIRVLVDMCGKPKVGGFSQCFNIFRNLQASKKRFISLLDEKPIPWPPRAKWRLSSRNFVIFKHFFGGLGETSQMMLGLIYGKNSK